MIAQNLLQAREIFFNEMADEKESLLIIIECSHKVLAFSVSAMRLLWDLSVSEIWVVRWP